MKLPRDLSGSELIKVLCKHYSYSRVDQEGSHVLLQTEHPRHHRIAIPELLLRKSQIPGSKAQVNFKNPNLKSKTMRGGNALSSCSLGIGVWILFGIWNLGFWISATDV